MSTKQYGEKEIGQIGVGDCELLIEVRRSVARMPSPADVLAVQEVEIAAAAQRRLAAARSARRATQAAVGRAASAPTSRAFSNSATAGRAALSTSATAGRASMISDQAAVTETSAARASTSGVSSAATERASVGISHPLRQGPIFAIVPLTSQASMNDMRNFVEELSASMNVVTSNAPVGGGPIADADAVPAAHTHVDPHPGDNLPPITPIQVISIAGERNTGPGQEPIPIMNDAPFAVPIPIQNPISQILPFPGALV